MRKHTHTHYFIQSIAPGNIVTVVAHSKDEETGELYSKFLDKKKALKLMEEEFKINPDFTFNLIKVVETYEIVKTIKNK